MTERVCPHGLVSGGRGDLRRPWLIRATCGFAPYRAGLGLWMGASFADTHPFVVDDGHGRREIVARAQQQHPAYSECGSCGRRTQWSGTAFMEAPRGCRGTWPWRVPSGAALRDLARGGWAVFGILRQAVPDQPAHVVRNAVRQRWRWLGDVRGRDLDRGSTAERRVAGQARVGDDAESIDVRRGSGRLPLGLLRREVLCRPHDNAGLGDRGGIQFAGGTEIGDLDVAVGPDDEIRRFDVSMDEPDVVSRVQGESHLGDDLQRSLDAQREPACRPVLRTSSPMRVEYGGERPARKILHDKECQVTLLAVVVDLGDSRMGQLGGVPGFRTEAVPEVRIVEPLGMQDLDGDLAMQDQIGSAPHLARTAESHALHEAIPIIDQYVGSDFHGRLPYRAFGGLLGPSVRKAYTSLCHAGGMHVGRTRRS